MTTRLRLFGRRLEPAPVTRVPLASSPDWAQANPRAIDRALARAKSRTSGGWFVVDATARIGGEHPRAYRIDGRDVVAWRCRSGVFVAPDSCPHMGAELSRGRVDGEKLRCPWHGLGLGPAGHGAWKPYETFDDGVLVWARMARDEAPTSKPILAKRPDRFVSGVIRMEAACEPDDVIANRLDPWHGVHFHPHSFGRLRVIDMSDDVLTVRVAYRVLGALAVEVDATFHSPEPRAIVMTIVDGEGTGSVVETHATPIDAGKTAIIEATLATSERRGFAAAIALSRWVRPMIEQRAARLWVEDAAYAERRYALRRSTPSDNQP